MGQGPGPTSFRFTLHTSGYRWLFFLCSAISGVPHQVFIISHMALHYDVPQTCIPVDESSLRVIHSVHLTAPNTQTDPKAHAFLWHPALLISTTIDPCACSSCESVRPTCRDRDTDAFAMDFLSAIECNPFSTTLLSLLEE